MTEVTSTDTTDMGSVIPTQTAQVVQSGHNPVVTVLRLLVGGGAFLLIAWHFFHIVSWLSDVESTSTPSAVQIIQVYSEGMFYILAVMAGAIAVYIFTRGMDQ
jgi:hypothetical protein